jgi:chromosome partitioning protein
MAKNIGKIKVDYQALKELRESMNLTRAIVAEEINWTEDKLARVEDGSSGNTKNTVSYAEDLCKHYDVEPGKYINYDYRKTKFIGLGMGKGGVTKTTSVCEISFNLQQTYKICVIDGDPQRNLTKRVMDDSIPIERTLKDLISVEESKINHINIEDYITHTRYGDHFDMIASDVGLYSVDRNLTNRYVPFGIFNYIKKELIKLGKYDYVIVDTSPHMSTYTLGLYLMFDKFYIPTTLEPDSYDAMPSFIDSLEDVKRLKVAMSHQDIFKIDGVFFTKVDGRMSVQKAVREDFKQVFTTEIMDIEVPVYAGISNAHYGRLQLGEYDNKDGRAKLVNRIYKQIAKEVIK